mgnify:CR=1 FL=1
MLGMGVVEGVEEVKSNDYHDLLIKEDNLPNVLFAMSPILVPVILIALASFADMTMAEDAMARVVLDTLGNRNIAMFLGMVFGWLLAVTHKEKALANYNQTSGKNEKSLFSMMFNGWVSEALEVALVPLIVTGFGGGFAQIIKDAPAAGELGDVVAATGFPGLLVPFVIGAAMECAVGSRTTAGMTAAGLCLPMLDSLGISAVACTVMIGAGTMGQPVHAQHGYDPYLQVQHPGGRRCRCDRRYRWRHLHHRWCDVRMRLGTAFAV